MAWLFVVIASALDVAWATMFKLYGFSKTPMLVLAAVFGASLPFIMGAALKTLPLGTAYASFVGLATLGTVATGIIFAGEAFSWQRMLFIGLIVAGIVGLQLLENPGVPRA